MVGQDRDQLLLVLGLQQGFDRAGRKLREGRIRRRKNSERALAFQGIYKPRRSDRRDKRFELTRTDSGVDDILGLCRQRGDRKGHRNSSGAKYSFQIFHRDLQ